MAKKTKAKPQWHSGLTGDKYTLDPRKEGIPPFLQVQNRVPLTAAQQAKLDTAAVQETTERKDWRKPPSLSWEEWDAMQRAQEEKAKAQTSERFAQLKANAPPRTPSLRKADGMLDAHHFAKLCGCPAKLVRRALRTTKAISKPAWGWCFTKADEARVVEVVNSWLVKTGNKTTPEVKAANAKAIAAKAVAKAAINAKAVAAAKPTAKAKKKKR